MSACGDSPDDAGPPQTATITTLAGGRPGEGPATTVAQSPFALAVQGTVVYVADLLQPVVRAVDTTTGNQQVIAGTGSAGFSGDGGLATSAQVNVGDIAADERGNLYIAGWDRIRKVDAAGIITTVAGTGVCCDGPSGDGGPAIEAQVSPERLAADGDGNLYILDDGRLRQIDQAGMITTIAVGFDNALTVDTLGTIYALAGNSIVKLDSSGELVGFVLLSGVRPFFDRGRGDGGPAFAARFALARLAVDAAGNAFVVESDRVRRIDRAGIVSTVAGIRGSVRSIGDGGPATVALLQEPSDIAVDDLGNLYVAEVGGNRVRRIDPTGTIVTVAGNGSRFFGGDGVPASAARFYRPSAIAVDDLGRVYIADNRRIRQIDSRGIIRTVAGGGTACPGDGQLATLASLGSPEGVAVANDGSVYIADAVRHRVRRVDGSGVIATVAGTGVFGFAGDGGPATNARLDVPRGVAVGKDGSLYIADSANARIRKVDPFGVIATIAGTGGEGSSGDGGPAIAAELDGPADVALDEAGNLYVAEGDGHRIRRVDPLGVITTVAGTGLPGFEGDGGSASAAKLDTPSGIAVDTQGNVYIAEAGDLPFIAGHRIRRVDPEGIITTVAGTGLPGFSGDGGPPTSAKLDTPRDVAVDKGGNLYIVDQANDRIRLVRDAR